MADFFGSQKTKQSSTFTPSQDQQALLQAALPFLKQFASNPGSPYQGPTVAGFDPAQLTGQQMALAATQQQKPIVGSAGTGNQFLTSGAVLSPDSNPALKQSIDMSTKAVADNLLQRVLPGIRDEAVLTGNFGSSRQGIGEALAIEGAAEQATSQAAQMANQNYQAGLSSMVQGIGLAPQIAQSQVIPALTTSGVGAERQGLQQMIIDALMKQHNDQRFDPLLIGQALLGSMGMIPGGTTTSTQKTPGTNPILGLLGLGMSGMSLFGGGAAGIPGGGSLGMYV